MLVVSQHAVIAVIHKQEQLFLTFRTQTVNLIQKQDTTLRSLDHPYIIPFRTGKGSLLITKQVCGYQLRIVCIFAAVYMKKGSVVLEDFMIDTIFVHHCRNAAFSCSGWSIQQCRKSVRRIGYTGFAFVHNITQRALLTDQFFKIGCILSLND